MKAFIIRSFVFACTLVALCYLLQYLIDSGLRKSEYKNYKEWNDIFNSRINGDLIILGSSRAWVQFSPQMIDSAFQLNSYNLGIDGYRFLMQYSRWKTYLNYNTKPKYLIQSLDAFMFEKQTGLFDKYQFLPYLSDETIFNGVNEYQQITIAERFIPLYKYNNQLPAIYVGLTTSLLNTKFTPNKDKGFKAQHKNWDNSFDQYKEKNKDGVMIGIDSVSVDRFNQFLSDCKTNNINVILVYSPEYIEAQKLSTNRDEIINLLNTFASKYNYPLLDYSRDTLCYSTEYFYNSQHLNSRGTKLFNRHLIMDIQRYRLIED